MFPIELYLGGTITSPGVEQMTNSKSTPRSGVLTLFFFNKDQQVQWAQNFKKASGSQNITDIYTFTKRPKTNNASLATLSKGGGKQVS